MTNLVSAAPVSAPLSPSLSQVIPHKIEIPSALGTIESRHFASAKAPLVVILQDAHAISGAQRQTQKLINYLYKTYRISWVALEGGSGPVDATLFRSFPDERVKKKIFGEYLQKAEITGPQMAAVFGEKGIRYVGIEDWDLYAENYFAYGRAAEAKPQALQKLAALKSALDQKRKVLFSAELNRFFEQAEAFREEKIGLREFLQSENVSAGSGAYPHLSALMDSFGKEKSFSSEELQSEIRKMAERFQKENLSRLHKDRQKEFNEHFRKFQTGESDNGTFLREFIKLHRAARIKLRLTAPMRELLANVHTLETIKGSRLLEELEALVMERQNLLVRGEEEKKLLKDYAKLSLLRNLVSLELTRDQMSKYQKNPQSYLELAGADLLAPALEFYQLVLARDQSFRRHLEGLIKKQKAKTVMVVAGGFHARGFEENLKAQGYSYAVVLPKVHSVEGHEQYGELMQGKLSYRPYLKTTFYDAFARAAAIKLAGEWSAPDFRRNLKIWRDEVIRELAGEGRTGDAARYTDYIDLLFKIYYDKFGDESSGLTKEEILSAAAAELQKLQKRKLSEVWKNFEIELGRFSRELKGLIARKELNLKNISALLENPVSIQSAGVLQPSAVLYPSAKEFLSEGKWPGKSAGRILIAEQTLASSSAPIRSELRESFQEMAKELTLAGDGAKRLQMMRRDFSVYERQSMRALMEHAFYDPYSVVRRVIAYKIRDDRSSDPLFPAEKLFELLARAEKYRPLEEGDSGDARLPAGETFDRKTQIYNGKEAILFALHYLVKREKAKSPEWKAVLEIIRKELGPWKSKFDLFLPGSKENLDPDTLMNAGSPLADAIVRVLWEYVRFDRENKKVLIWRKETIETLLRSLYSSAEAGQIMQKILEIYKARLDAEFPEEEALGKPGWTYQEILAARSRSELRTENQPGELIERWTLNGNEYEIRKGLNYGLTPGYEVWKGNDSLFYYAYDSKKGTIRQFVKLPAAPPEMALGLFNKIAVELKTRGMKFTLSNVINPKMVSLLRRVGKNLQIEMSFGPESWTSIEGERLAERILNGEESRELSVTNKYGITIGNLALKRGKEAGTYELSPLSGEWRAEGEKFSAQDVQVFLMDGKVEIYNVNFQDDAQGAKIYYYLPAGASNENFPYLQDFIRVHPLTGYRFYAIRDSENSLVKLQVRLEKSPEGYRLNGTLRETIVEFPAQGKRDPVRQRVYLDDQDRVRVEGLDGVKAEEIFYDEQLGGTFNLRADPEPLVSAGRSEMRKNQKDFETKFEVWLKKVSEKKAADEFSAWKETYKAPLFLMRLRNTTDPLVRKNIAQYVYALMKSSGQNKLTNAAAAQWLKILFRYPPGHSSGFVETLVQKTIPLKDGTFTNGQLKKGLAEAILITGRKTHPQLASFYDRLEHLYRGKSEDGSFIVIAPDPKTGKNFIPALKTNTLLRFLTQKMPRELEARAQLFDKFISEQTKARDEFVQSKKEKLKPEPPAEIEEPESEDDFDIASPKQSLVDQGDLEELWRAAGQEKKEELRNYAKKAAVTKKTKKKAKVKPSRLMKTVRKILSQRDLPMWTYIFSAGLIYPLLTFWASSLLTMPLAFLAAFQAGFLIAGFFNEEMGNIFKRYWSPLIGPSVNMLASLAYGAVNPSLLVLIPLGALLWNVKYFIEEARRKAEPKPSSARSEVRKTKDAAQTEKFTAHPNRDIFQGLDEDSKEILRKKFEEQFRPLEEPDGISLEERFKGITQMARDIYDPPVITTYFVTYPDYRKFIKTGEKIHLVGLGSSPAWVVRAAEAMDPSPGDPSSPDYPYQFLPISGRQNEGPGTIQIDRATPEQVAGYQQYLMERQLDPASLMKRPGITVFIDSIVSGTTLEIFFHKILEPLAQKQGVSIDQLKTKIGFYLFEAPSSDTNHDYYGRDPIEDMKSLFEFRHIPFAAVRYEKQLFSSLVRESDYFKTRAVPQYLANAWTNPERPFIRLDANAALMQFGLLDYLDKNGFLPAPRSEVREGVPFQIGGVQMRIVKKEDGRTFVESFPGDGKKKQKIFSNPEGNQLRSRVQLMDDMDFFPIGKDWTNQIRLDLPGVEPVHAMIIRDFGGSFQLVDFQSPQGTFVQGRRLFPVDVISLGGRTRGRLQYQAFIYMLGIRYFMAFYDRKIKTWTRYEIPFDGNLAEGMTQAAVILGRGEAPSVRIQLNDPYVSIEHLKLSLSTDGKIFVQDNSLNGTYVNGEKISKKSMRAVFSPSIPQTHIFQPYEHFEEIKQLLRLIMFREEGEDAEEQQEAHADLAAGIRRLNELFSKVPDEAVIFLKLAMTAAAEEDQNAIYTHSLATYGAPFLKHLLYVIHQIGKESGLKVSPGLAAFLSLFLLDRVRGFREYTPLQYEAAKAFESLQFEETQPFIISKMARMLEDEEIRRQMGFQLVGALGNLKGTDPLIHLIRNTKEFEPALRTRAIEALTQDPAKFAGREDEIAKMIQELLYEQSDDIILAAMHALEKMNRFEAVFHLALLAYSGEEKEPSNKIQAEAKRIFEALTQRVIDQGRPQPLEAPAETPSVTVEVSPAAPPSSTVDPTLKIDKKDLGERSEVRLVPPGFGLTNAAEIEKKYLVRASSKTIRELYRKAREREKELYQNDGEAKEKREAEYFIDQNKRTVKVSASRRWTITHERDVMVLAVLIGRAMGLYRNDLEKLALAARFHDIGKTAVPFAVLNFPGKINAGDLYDGRPMLKILQEHVPAAEPILKELRFPEEIRKIILQHHEKLDGTGYGAGDRRPDRKEINLLSKILMVADFSSSLLRKRVYQKRARTEEEVLSILYPEVYRKRYDLKIFLNLAKVFKRAPAPFRSEMRTDEKERTSPWPEIPARDNDSTVFGLTHRQVDPDPEMDDAANEIIPQFLVNKNAGWEKKNLKVRVIGEGAHFRVYIADLKQADGTWFELPDVYKISRQGKMSATDDGGPRDLKKFLEYIGELGADTEDLTEQLPRFYKVRKFIFIRQEKGLPLEDAFYEAFKLPGTEGREIATKTFRSLLRLYNNLLTQKGVFVVDATPENAIRTGTRKKHRTKLADFERAIRLEKDGTYWVDRDQQIRRNLFDRPANMLNFFRTIWPIINFYDRPDKKIFADAFLREIDSLGDPKNTQDFLPLAAFFKDFLREENRDLVLGTLKEYFLSKDEENRTRQAWEALGKKDQAEIIAGITGLILKSVPIEPVRQEKPKHEPKPKSVEDLWRSKLSELQKDMRSKMKHVTEYAFQYHEMERFLVLSHKDAAHKRWQRAVHRLNIVLGMANRIYEDESAKGKSKENPVMITEDGHSTRPLYQWLGYDFLTKLESLRENAAIYDAAEAGHYPFEIPTALGKNYLLTDFKIKPALKGKGNVWIVEAAEGRFILKKPQFRKTPSWMDWEASVLEQLGSQRAAQIRKTLNKKNYFQLAGELYVLYELVEGEEFTWGQVEGDKLKAAAQWLAGMHKDLQNFVPAEENYKAEERPQVIGVLNYEMGLKRLEDLKNQIMQRGPPSSVEKIFMNEYDFIQNQIDFVRSRFTPGKLNQLPVSMTHGDFHQGNGRYQADGTFKAFDFEYAAREARIRDLANAFLLRFPPGLAPGSASLAFDKVETFITSYHAANPLTPQEIEILPDVFRLAYLEGVLLFAGFHGKRESMAATLKEQIANLKLIDLLDWQGLQSKLLAPPHAMQKLFTAEEMKKALQSDPLFVKKIGSVEKLEGNPAVFTLRDPFDQELASLAIISGLINGNPHITSLIGFFKGELSRYNRDLFRLVLRLSKEKGFIAADLEYREDGGSSIKNFLRDLLRMNGVPDDQLDLKITEFEQAYPKERKKTGITIPLQELNFDKPFVISPARSEVRKSKREFGGINEIRLSELALPEEVLAAAQKNLGAAVELLTSRGSERRNEIDRIYGEMISEVLAMLQKEPTKDRLIGKIFSESLAEILRQKTPQNDMKLVNEIAETIRVVTAKALVLGAAVRNEESGLQFAGISENAKMLLSDRKALAELANIMMGEGVAIDAAFLEPENQKDIEGLLKGASARNFRVAVPFNSDMPRQAAFTRSLVKLFLEVSAISYSESRSLNESKFRGAGLQAGFFRLLLNGSRFDLRLNMESTAWADTGAVRSATGVLGLERSLNFFELLLKKEFLKKKDGKYILDQNAVSEGIGLINSLAEEAVKRGLIARSA